MRKLFSALTSILVVMIMLLIVQSFQGKKGSFDSLGLFDAGQTDILAAPFDNKNLFSNPEGTFNVQIQAVEVTQGMRGHIPLRITPTDPLTLVSDGAVHVASRRTVVRAYPWISLGANTKVSPITAQLWAYRNDELLPGSPIPPLNFVLEEISPGWDLETMRSDAALSWNFLLPSAWTATTSEQGSFTMRFVVEVNPSGPEHIAECPGCTSDNQVTLDGQGFVEVPPIMIKPYLVDHTFTDSEGNEVSFPAATLEEFYKALDTVHQLYPISDGKKGVVVLEPEHISWNGPLKSDGEQLFAGAMIDQYLPGGSLDSDIDGVYHIFLFSPSFRHRNDVNALFEGAKTGLAWIGLPYVQAGARGPELVHELAHAIGLDHAGNLHGEKSDNPDYPDACGQVEPDAYGFDVWLIQAVPPVSDRGRTHDFMSYERSKPIWVSIYTWKAIASLLGQPGL